MKNGSNYLAKLKQAQQTILLKIVYRAVDELKLDPANPRRHSKKQIRQIANSIRTFGFIVPVLIDRHGRVLAGHGRLLACRELGSTEVPTLCLEHLTPAQARAFMIADNRLTEIATWDDKLLAEQLKELSLVDLDFSIEVIGFEMGEIDLRIASREDASDPADDLDPVAFVSSPNSWASTRPRRSSCLAVRSARSNARLRRGGVIRRRASDGLLYPRHRQVGAPAGHAGLR
jgi:ParB-like chromosome segregation protein Spo0J